MKSWIIVAACLAVCACSTVPEQPQPPAQPETPLPPDAAGMPAQPTPAALALLREHEAYRTHVYLGPTGKPTAGLGHKLTDTERARYRLGDRVAEEDLERWEREDTAGAWAAAREQATEIGEPRLLEALFAVNYQLGVFWHTKFVQTWAYLKARRWLDAAREAADSAWYRQTPERVADFQRALRAL